MTPLKSIRKYCLWCCCGNFKEVELCPDKSCSLWAYRFGKKLTEIYNYKLTPCKAIKARCNDCIPDNRNAKNCEDSGCSLYPYRLGKNPAREGLGGNPNINKTV